jgi:endonuclease/exonuclease/phosphatase family metal-dependent hydrolase
VISFYNLHVNPPWEELSMQRLGPHRAEARRISRAQFDLRQANFRALAADLADNPYPVLVAGDFNTSPAMGMLRLLPDDLVDPSPAIRSLYPVSWHDQWPRQWRIDWVFTTEDITVHEYRMIRSGAFSDHSGQWLSVSID